MSCSKTSKGISFFMIILFKSQTPGISGYFSNKSQIKNPKIPGLLGLEF